jgi:putative AbiEi antitoxin of type IV toxin-antitoxin system
VPIDPKLLAHYDALTSKASQLENELAAVEREREKVRRVLLGDNLEVTDPISLEPTPKLDKSVKGLSAWERIGRGPPEALKSTVAVVKQLGRATNKQVANKLGIPVSAASLRLSRAARDGFLERVAQGIYEVHPLGGVMMPSKKK